MMTFAALVLAAVLAVGDLGIAAERSVPIGRRPVGGFNRVPITTPVVIIPQGPTAPTAPLPPANSRTEPLRTPVLTVPGWHALPPSAPVVQPSPTTLRSPAGVQPITVATPVQASAAALQSATAQRTGPLRTRSYMQSRRQSSTSTRNPLLLRSLGNLPPTDPRAFPAVQGAAPNSSLIHPRQSLGNLPRTIAPNTSSSYQGSYSRRSMGNTAPTVAPTGSTWSGLNRRRSIGNLSPSAPVSSAVPSPASIRRRSMGNLSP